MSPKQETLAIQSDTDRIADIPRDIRDCIEDEAEEDRQESEWDAYLRRNEEFLNRERHR
jgi:hypothetical protein